MNRFPALGNKGDGITFPGLEVLREITLDGIEIKAVPDAERSFLQLRIGMKGYVLGIDDRMVLRSSILMYLFPLLALLFGAFLGKVIDDAIRLFEADYLSAGVGIAAMLLVFTWLRRHPRLLMAGGDCQPRILRRGRSVD